MGVQPPTTGTGTGRENLGLLVNEWRPTCRWTANLHVARCSIARLTVNGQIGKIAENGLLVSLNGIYLV